MIGALRYVVMLANPGAPVPDGDGGYTETFLPLDPPTWHCSIEPSTAQSLERIGAGTVTAQATHIVTGHYHPGITTATQLMFGGRRLNVLAVRNRAERDIETNLVCAEVVA